MTIRRNAKAGEQVRYIGANIGYMPGVPMKDMDAEEWNALDGDLRENAIKAGLYQLGGPEEGAKETADMSNEPLAPAQAEKATKAEAAKTTKSEGQKEG